MLSLLLVSIVRADPTPGISVTITDVDPSIRSLGDTATYTVNAESITTEDENVKLTVSGDPDLAFKWTLKEFILAAGAIESFGLEATYSGTGTGDFAFTVLGEAWPLYFTYDEAVMFGVIETSSFQTTSTYPHPA